MPEGGKSRFSSSFVSTSSQSPLEFLTGEQQSARALGPSLQRGLHEGREALQVAGVHLDVRLPQQRVERLQLAGLRRVVQRRVALAVRLVHVHARALQQQLQQPRARPRAAQRRQVARGRLQASRVAPSQ